MTATPQTESKSSSRRALLAGALGGIGALAASVIGRTNPVRAEGQSIVVGGEYGDATSVTKIANMTNAATVLWGASDSGYGVTGSSNSQTGVYGLSSSSAGVRGVSTTGTGSYGLSNSGSGVRGVSTSSFGVSGDSSSSSGLLGDSTATNAAATVGRSLGGSTGVLGFSGLGAFPAAKAKTGVYGYAAQDNASQGVWGHSPAGNGVVGSTSTGYAGYFSGKVYSTQFYEISEIGTPAAPAPNRARLFVKDNGAGKTQLCVRFHTGAVKILATES